MRKLMDVPAVCEATGLKPPTIRAWAGARRIASVKLGKRLLIPIDEVEKLIEMNLRPAQSAPDKTAVEVGSSVSTKQ
jgi:excisionase family DNA binding protein